MRPLGRFLFALRRALLRFADRLVPPQVVLLERSTGAAATQLLAWVAKLGLPDLLAKNPKTAPELAAALGLHLDALARVLRALTEGGLFALDPDTGRFRNTRLGAALRSDAFASMGAFVQYFATRANLDSWAALESVVQSGENSFERLHGASQWAWLAAHPAEEALFALAMTSLTALDALALAQAYPFGELHSVCDVGGGRGTLLAELLRKYPKLEGAVFDAPGVAPLARAALDAAGFADRAAVHPGDLFTQIPKGFAGYLLKDVLHDWDDARCRQILRAVRDAATPGTRLFICEVLVEPLEAVTSSALPGATIDLQMLVVCSGGRQRSEAELALLLGQSGFRSERVWATAAPISLLEATAI